MFTQCEHCQAIFRINMREVTVAKGQLRCGECHQVFNASKSLSTTMPKPYSEQQVEYLKANSETNESSQPQRDTDIPARSELTKQTTKLPEIERPRLIKGIEKEPENTPRWLKLTAILLAALLTLQVLYSYRESMTDASEYQPDKIQMLSHNVFAHPIDPGVLLISASIENRADHDQPYPILEVRLTNSKSEVVALRRFTPDEYLDNYSKGLLIKKNQISSLKLKIKDPGNQATRFQFDFL
jgi:predicted Zn finger-like uncharacterized protein